MNINNNNYSIIEIIEMLRRKELIVNNEYQRGSGLWPDGPCSYFIDTIIQNYPFPKIYFYEYMERENRKMKKEIVDGQQRIKAITRFFEDDFALRGDTEHQGKKFSELDEENQESFLSYSVSIDVIRNANRSQILQMFRRMNAYTLPLNTAEQRHSIYHGPFKWFINKLADYFNEFFVDYGVFTNRQIMRMSDAEFLTECILSMERGVVSTSNKDLRNLYKKYDKEFIYEDDYTIKIKESFNFITRELTVLRNTFMMKPYALHSLVTALIQNRYGIDSITAAWETQPINAFALNNDTAAERLLTLARAHEAKEDEGPHGRYVWGCLAGTNRAPRRTARTAAILRALGAEVPENVDANLT